LEANFADQVSLLAGADLDDSTDGIDDSGGFSTAADGDAPASGDEDTADDDQDTKTEIDATAKAARLKASFLDMLKKSQNSDGDGDGDGDGDSDQTIGGLETALQTGHLQAELQMGDGGGINVDKAMELGEVSDGNDGKGRLDTSPGSR